MFLRSSRFTVHNYSIEESRRLGPLTRGGFEAQRAASIPGCIDNRRPAVNFLSHPAFLPFLIFVFVIAGWTVARWWSVRKQQSDADKLPTIPASEIVHPGGTPTPAPVTGPKHTPQEVLERALRRGDKALENLEGPSLPFLDTRPLAHQDHPEIDTADGKQTPSADGKHAPTDGPSNRE